MIAMVGGVRVVVDTVGECVDSPRRRLLQTEHPVLGGLGDLKLYTKLQRRLLLGRETEIVPPP